MYALPGRTYATWTSPGGGGDWREGGMEVYLQSRLLKRTVLVARAQGGGGVRRRGVRRMDRTSTARISAFFALRRARGGGGGGGGRRRRGCRAGFTQGVELGFEPRMSLSRTMIYRERPRRKRATCRGCRSTTRPSRDTAALGRAKRTAGMAAIFRPVAACACSASH